MHWLALTAIAATANAGLVLLWKHFSGRADIFVIIALNNILSGLLVLAYALYGQQVKLVLDAPFWGAVVAMSLCSALILVFFSLALKSGPVSYVNPIFSGMLNTTVVLIALLFFAEKLTLISTVGIAAVMVGVTLIVVGG